ncbi:DsbA family protein [Pseudonocardia bannensis]|uniref:Thioredoxin domain-containing protein n=1 Tax=Pseudonocardia bannensis TaxID=630973 RepID=A0A848DSA9_9PSEU|nr:thioredoxin domain-containing protein [Pseudonocardia bannensis]NMH95393.1 thioredoxin domain-containing protein [Pseudonocardia bannensis]
MGGASRSEKQRRQQAANQRLAAAGITPRKSGTGGNRSALIVVGVVVAIAVVVGLVVAMTRGSGTAPVAANYPVAVSGTVVTAGQAGAPVTVDVYEDYLCPQCERFENAYGDEITAALNEGKIKVNYHATAILDQRTSPPGYSTLSANAGLCAANAGIFPAFHKQLFDEQPSEGGAGFTAAELVAKGNALGAAPGFEQCVTTNGNAAAIAAATEAAARTPSLTTNGQFGTPTVAVGGQKINLNDRDWLKNATGQA